MLNPLESAEYKTLTDEFHEEFPSAVPEERCLVDILVQSVWRQRQCWRIEQEVWNAEGKITTNEALLRVLTKLEPVGRAGEAASKRFSSAHRQLLAIRAARAKAAVRKPKLMPPPKSTGLFQVPKRAR
jgi:hypothetical protein